MKLLNILYTNKMSESVAFYDDLGLNRTGDGAINDWWNEYDVDGAAFALHWNQDEPIVTASNPELNFRVSNDELVALHERLKAQGATVTPDLQHLDGMRGQFFVVTDPNGIRVQFNS